MAAACLAWVIHDVRLGAIWQDMGRIRWWWVCLAIVFDVSTYVCQGKRWALLLRHIGNLPTLKATQAVYIGLFASEILPLRAGEVVRAWLAARWMNARMTAVIPTILVERLFDAIWLAIAVGLALLFVPLPKYLLDAEGALVGIVFAAVGLFLFILLRRPAITRKITGIGRSKWLYSSFGMSAVLLLCQILAYWLMMWAYGIGLTFWRGAAVLAIVRLGTVVPGAPANLGTYQFFTVLGLTLFGVDKTTATGFSVVVFLILTIPLWGIGGMALVRAGLTLKDIRGGIGSAHEV